MYKLVRLIPSTPHRRTPQTFTIVAGDKYPRPFKFTQGEGWKKVDLDVAELLEDELVNDMPIFEVCTLQQATMIDRAEQYAKERRARRASEAIDMTRKSASDWANDPDFAPEGRRPKKPSAPARREKPPASPVGENFREWDDVEPTPRKAQVLPRRVEKMIEESDGLSAYPDPEEPDLELSHPEDTVGDENDGDTGDDEAPVTVEAVEAETDAPAPKRGRRKGK